MHRPHHFGRADPRAGGLLLVAPRASTARCARGAAALGALRQQIDARHVLGGAHVHLERVLLLGPLAIDLEAARLVEHERLVLVELVRAGERLLEKLLEAARHLQLHLRRAVRAREQVDRRARAHDLAQVVADAREADERAQAMRDARETVGVRRSETLVVVDGNVLVMQTLQHFHE